MGGLVERGGLFERRGLIEDLQQIKDLTESASWSKPRKSLCSFFLHRRKVLIKLSVSYSHTLASFVNKRDFHSEVDFLIGR